MPKKNRTRKDSQAAPTRPRRDETQPMPTERSLTLSITVELGDGSQPSTIVERVQPDHTVSDVIVIVLDRLGRECVPSQWSLVFEERDLPLTSQLNQCVQFEGTPLELILRPRAQETIAEDASFDYGMDDRDGSFYGKTIDAQDHSAFDAPIPPLDTPSLAEALTGRQRGQSGPNLKRHATVRYYRRMNPECLYPLMVLVTRKAIEEVKADRLGQQSVSSVTIRAADPVEIEPLLPGCDCVPPRIVARLESGDLSAVFRVLPRAVGRLEGATVVIRQDHAVIAAIPLEMRVSRKLWAVLLGVATFVLPAISALLKHFGLDFETQAGRGFDVYLAVARVIFDQLSPSVLTAVLGVCTGLVWWSCRPRAEDVFWDLGIAGPETRLQRVRDELQKGSNDAVDELKAVVTDFPEHLPARLLLAEWHYHTGAYRQALDDYALALKCESATPKDYLRASLAASNLGDTRRALCITQDAGAQFGESRLPPSMLFNAGCYSALLGDPEKAMSYLRKAVAAGATDIAAYSRDPDLDSLRGRSDFQELLADGDLTVHFACPHCDRQCSAAISTVGTRRQCMKCKGEVLVPPPS